MAHVLHWRGGGPLSDGPCSEHRHRVSIVGQASRIPVWVGTASSHPLSSQLIDATRTQIDFPTYLGANYDASTTNLTYRIDPSTSASHPLEITVSFLSPITPTSTLRQSIPASYVTVHVHGEVSVNVYMDVNGGWVSGDTRSHISWQYDAFDANDNKPALRRWRFQRQSELLFSEIRDRAEWGTLHFTAPAVCKLESSVTLLVADPSI